MPPLNPMQLSVISDEYYFKGFVLGRDRLYEHMAQTYNVNFGWGGTPNMFDSRDQVEEWLRYQHVNTIHQRQRKPKSIDHFRPVRPLHSISIDLIDSSLCFISKVYFFEAQDQSLSCIQLLAYLGCFLSPLIREIGI